MLNFTDSTGTEWTVYEIRRQGDDTDVWGYLPQGFRAGWLCFESTRGKRRLSPVPDGWKSFEDVDLEQMLTSATPVRARRNTSPRGLTLDDGTLDDSTDDDKGFRA